MFSMPHRKTESRKLEDGETIISNKFSEQKSLQAFKNGKKIAALRAANSPLGRNYRSFRSKSSEGVPQQKPDVHQVIEATGTVYIRLSRPGYEPGVHQVM